MTTPRSIVVARLVRIAAATPESMGDAFYQVGVIASAWPQLRSDEQKRIRMAAAPESGLLDRRTDRKTGRTFSVYDSVKQGVEVPGNLTPEQKRQTADWEGGRWQLKYTVICEAHATCVCVASLKLARETMRHPDFCDDCKDEDQEKTKESAQTNPP